jgi:hypothetical protein
MAIHQGIYIMERNACSSRVPSMRRFVLRSKCDSKRQNNTPMRTPMQTIYSGRHLERLLKVYCRVKTGNSGAHSLDPSLPARELPEGCSVREYSAQISGAKGSYAKGN